MTEPPTIYRLTFRALSDTTPPTNRLKRLKRLARHRSGSGAMATKKYGVKSVVHTEEWEKFGMARHRKRELTLFWKKYGTYWGGGWTATT